VYGRQKDEATSTESYIRELLDIPAHYAVLNIISIGYPDEARKPFDEDKLPVEKIHSEKF
jgi:nitroreductase